MGSDSKKCSATENAPPGSTIKDQRTREAQQNYAKSFMPW